MSCPHFFFQLQQNVQHQFPIHHHLLLLQQLSSLGLQAWHPVQMSRHVHAMYVFHRHLQSATSFQNNQFLKRVQPCVVEFPFQLVPFVLHLLYQSLHNLGTSHCVPLSCNLIS